MRVAGAELQETAENHVIIRKQDAILIKYDRHKITLFSHFAKSYLLHISIRIRYRGVSYFCVIYQLLNIEYRNALGKLIDIKSLNKPRINGLCQINM